MNIEKMKSLKKDIEENIGNMQLKDAESLLAVYKKENSKSLDNLIYQAVIKFYSGEYSEAAEILNKGIEISPFNFDLNYNLAIVLENQGKYVEALKQYKRTFLLADKEPKLEIENHIEALIDFICENNDDLSKMDILKVLESEKNKLKFKNLFFPNYNKINSYIGKFFRQDYFIAQYDKYGEVKDKIKIPHTLSMRGFHSIEIIKSKKLNYKEYNDSHRKIIPISTLKDNSPILIYQNNQRNIVINRLANRFYYYRINGKAEIRGENLIIGEPIILKRDESKKKLVLNIFIDGLSQSFLEEFTLKKTMPYTFKYFSEGTICNNAYTVAEWTLPSVASIYSGKYIANHMIYHPNYNTSFSENNKLLSEVFNEEGYFTGKIDGNWRTVPPYGYYRGIDRALYKESSRNMGVEEIVTEIIEHLDSYKQTNQFVWSCVFDLHDIADNFDLKMSAAVNIDIKNLNYLKDLEKHKSVKQSYSEDKKKRYMQQLRRIDLYLSLLYNYIAENYKDENILVSLISDHGQSYFIPEGNGLLSPERIKIPMMFRGSGVKKGICNEFIESIDFGRIIEKISGIEDKSSGLDLDSNLPVYFGGDRERIYTYSESIYPGSTYKAAINFKEYICKFETEALVGDDARFNIDKFSLVLVNKKDKKEFIDQKIYDECLEIILNHVAKLILY